MRACLCLRCIAVCLAASLLLSMPAFTCSQGQLAAKDDLEKAFKTNAARRDKLIVGEETANKGDIDIARASARWYIYRITIKWTKPGDMDAVHTEFSRKIGELMDAKYDPANKEYRGMIARELVSCMKDVFVRDITADPSTVTHAAMMLPTLGKMRNEDVNRYLIGLCDKEQHDVLRLNAVKALRESMPIVLPPEGADADFIKWDRVKRDAKIVNALTQIIDDEIKGKSPQQDAVTRFLRREAIISLAHAGSPAALAFPEKDIQKLKAPAKNEEPLQGQVAPTLLRVLANQKMVPAASTQERIEAALGLCAMRHKNMPEYKSELATYLIGRLILDMVKEYKADLVNITAVGAKKQLPRVGWKSEASRMKAGLEKLRDHAKGTPGAKAAANLEMKARLIFDSITKSRPDTYDEPNDADVKELRDLLIQITPENGAVFRSLTPPPIDLPPALKKQ